jgi:Xaa-Pro dipeptidase
MTAARTATRQRIGFSVRECDVAATVMHALAEGTPDCGGGAAVPVTMPVTPWAQAPHIKWTDRKYEKGRQTNFEIGAFVHRYCCPLSRTVHLGTPPDRLRYVHDAVLGGFLAGFEATKAGATCGDVYRAFSKAFKPTGRLGGRDRIACHESDPAESANKTPSHRRSTLSLGRPSACG